jgi:hypothetical protein
MIKKVTRSFVRALTELSPVAVYSLFLSAFGSTCLGLFLDLGFFPESLFYILSIVIYFALYFLLQNQDQIKNKIDSALHASLSGLFMGFYSYQVFQNNGWLSTWANIWEYKLILYLVVSCLQAAVLLAAKDWLARKKARRLEQAKANA